MRGQGPSHAPHRLAAPHTPIPPTSPDPGGVRSQPRDLDPFILGAPLPANFRKSPRSSALETGANTAPLFKPRPYSAPTPPPGSYFTHERAERSCCSLQTTREKGPRISRRPRPTAHSGGNTGQQRLDATRPTAPSGLDWAAPRGFREGNFKRQPQPHPLHAGPPGPRLPAPPPKQEVTSPSVSVSFRRPRPRLARGVRRRRGRQRHSG